MATTILWNGQSYSVPANLETGWGTQVSNYLIAISAGALQKSGGAFALTADVDFGASFGLKSAYFKSRSADIAASGMVRLANNESIAWRNAANNADVSLKMDASNKLAFGSSAVSQAEFGYLTGVTSAIQTQLNGKINSGSIVNADIDAAAAIAGTKISPNFGSQNISTTGTLASGVASFSISDSGAIANGVELKGTSTGGYGNRIVWSDSFSVDGGGIRGGIVADAQGSNQGRLRFFTQSAASTLTECASATYQGAWTLGTAGVTTTHSFNANAINQRSTTTTAAAYYRFGNSDFSENAFIGRESSTGGTLITGAAGYSLAMTSDDGIYFGNNSGVMHGSCVAGAWTLGPAGGLGGTVPGLTVQGGNSLGGSNAADAAIKLGNNAGYGAAIQFSDISQTTLYIDSLINSNTSKIQFRTKTAATPVNVGDVTGAGAWTFGNASAANQGIILAGNDSGYTPTALKYYQEGSIVSGWVPNGSGSSGSTSVTIRIARIGNIVTLSMPDVRDAIPAGTSTSLNSSVDLPSWAQPSSIIVLPIWVQNNGGTFQVGVLEINTSGNLALWRDVNQTAWTNGAGAGNYQTFCCSYSI